MLESAKTAEVAEPLYQIKIQLFAEEDDSSASIDAGGSPGTDTSPADDFDDDGHDISIGEKQVLFDGSLQEQNQEDDLDKRPEPDSIPDPVKKEQSPEANAAFAEMRRAKEEAERKLADDQARRDQFYADKFGKSHGIFTEAQYMTVIEHAQQQQEQARQQELQTRPAQVANEVYRQLMAEGYDEGVAREIANARGYAAEQELKHQALMQRLDTIENQVKQEKEIASKQQQEATAQQIIQSWEADRAKLREEYGELVPESLEGLDPGIVEGLQGGLSFEKAWLAANIDKVVDLAKGKGAQKVTREINSKAHLDTEKGGGSGVGKQVHVSDEKLQVWRALGYSDKEARQKEARYQRQKRG